MYVPWYYRYSLLYQVEFEREFERERVSLPLYSSSRYELEY